MKDYYEKEELDLTGLHIENDDEYKDMDYYKYEGKNSNYNYVKRKYEPNYNKLGDYISLYRDNYSEKLGYYYLSCILSVKPILYYPNYTRYGELLEFGFVNNDVEDVKFLLNHMFNYASDCNLKFIKVKTKEKAFEKFYELLKTYPHTEDEKHIYLDVVDKKLERYEHLKHYEDDALTIKELYHLYAERFKILKDTCEYELYDNEKFVIDRKTRKVTYPKRFINLNEKHLTFSQNALDLMCLYKMDAYGYKDEVVDVAYHIDGYDYPFIKIGRELMVFRDFKYEKDSFDVKDGFIDFVIKACEEYGFSVLYVCSGSKLKLKQLYATCSKEWNYLPSIIEEHKNPKPKYDAPFARFFPKNE